MQNESDIKAEIWQTIQDMNRVWAIDHEPEKLAEYFAPEMEAITPVDRHRRQGRQACIDGWSGFVKATTIHHWSEYDPSILLMADGKAAVVTCYFEIEYEMGSRRIKMGGRDLFVLEERKGRWWIVADHYSPFPS